MTHLTVQWGLVFCNDSSPSTWSIITTLPLYFFWHCIKTCEFTENSASEMSRPQKKHCKSPQVSLCLSCDSDKILESFDLILFCNNQFFAWLWQQGLAPQETQFNNGSFAQLHVCSGQTFCSGATSLGSKSLGSQPKKQSCSKGFIGQPAGVSLSSSPTHSYFSGQNLPGDTFALPGLEKQDILGPLAWLITLARYHGRVMTDTHGISWALIFFFRLQLFDLQLLLYLRT